MIIGYARTSTLEQVAGYESQIEELKSAKAEKIYKEQVSSVAKRDELDAALDYARDGDIFMVTKLDRLARSVKHLVAIVDGLETKGVVLKVLNIGLDTGTPTGKLMLNMLGAVAQFEREMMLERQREGIAKAKAEGKYTGRPKETNPGQVVQLKQEGLRVPEIQKKLNISRASVYRLLNEVT